MSYVGRRTRAMLLEQRLTKCRGTGRLYQSRLQRYSYNWNVIAFDRSIYQELSQALLQPIMDLMTGADGGVGFSKLRHSFLPEMLQKSAEGGELEAEFILMMTRMSMLCKTLMEKP